VICSLWPFGEPYIGLQDKYRMDVSVIQKLEVVEEDSTESGQHDHQNYRRYFASEFSYTDLCDLVRLLDSYQIIALGLSCCISMLWRQVFLPCSTAKPPRIVPGLTRDAKNWVPVIFMELRLGDGQCGCRLIHDQLVFVSISRIIPILLDRLQMKSRDVIFILLTNATSIVSIATRGSWFTLFYALRGHTSGDDNTLIKYMYDIFICIVTFNVLNMLKGSVVFGFMSPCFFANSPNVRLYVPWRNSLSSNELLYVRWSLH
jgi:hypothetical protein